MKRLVTVSLLGLSFAFARLGAAAAAPPPITTPPGQALAQPLSPDEQRDWDCLDAAVQQWGLHPTSTADASAPSADTLKSLRSYFLGRLSAELGDERLMRWLRDAQLHKPRSVAWAHATASVCLARMERSTAALKPMESKDFTLQNAASSR